MCRFLARLLTIALPLAAVLVLAAPPPARAVELGLVTDLTWGAAAADQEREYAALDDLGARWVRVEVNWAEVEPSRGAYHAWSLEQIDAAVHRNRAAGRQVVVMIGKAPQWASGSADHGTPPRDPADFARFAAFMAQRYAADGVAGYEIWNEPNIGRFWGGRPDAAAYVALLRAAGAAIRAADPGTRIVFGGLSTNDLAYLRAAYAAGAEGLFDVMALHPYSCEERIDDVKRDGDGVIVPGSFLGYRAVREFMLAQGDARPMWFTELGWSTTSEPCGVSEAAQAQRLQASVELMDRDPYVQAVMFYNLRNNYWLGDTDTTEARYGLLTSDFRAKPAYAAFRVAAAPQRLRLRARGHRAGAHLSGRVSGGAAARVRVTLRRRGKHARRVRLAAVRGGRFSVSLRRLGPGRWHALAELVDHPHVRAARRLVVR